MNLYIFWASVSRTLSCLFWIMFLELSLSLCLSVWNFFFMWLGDNVGLVLNDIFNAKYFSVVGKKCEIKVERKLNLKQKWEREKECVQLGGIGHLINKK